MDVTILFLWYEIALKITDIACVLYKGKGPVTGREDP
jgi:hypothetical protein